MASTAAFPAIIRWEEGTHLQELLPAKQPSCFPAPATCLPFLPTTPLQSLSHWLHRQHAFPEEGNKQKEKFSPPHPRPGEKGT